MRTIAIAAALLLLGGAAGASTAAMPTSGGAGDVDAVSCVAAGECTAGGYYHDGRFHIRGYLVTETSGSWGTATQVPGLAALDTGGGGSVDSISCVAVGECTAAGSYYENSYRSQAFVVSETSGSWGKAIEVPGLAKLNAGGEAYINSLSCSAAGECAAGGVYYDRRGNNRAFVVSETNGSWGTAIKVPGTGKFNSAEVDSVSCAAPGECVAGGNYQDGVDSTGGLNLRAFVVSETNGIWRRAIEVPGTAKLNTTGNGTVNAVSCATAGNCAAGGSYTNSKHVGQAFVATETNGTWAKAITVAGINSSGDAEVDTISCPAAGDCSAGGFDSDKSGEQAFTVDETNGTWGAATEVPGTAKLNHGWGEVVSISCPAAGNCSAAGDYVDADSNQQVFVADETNGTWGTAIEVPGTPALNTGGDAQVYAISCATVGDCATGGFFDPAGRDRPVDRPFVADETNGSWGDASTLDGFPEVCVVPDVLGKKVAVAKKAIRASGCRVGKVTFVNSQRAQGRVAAQRPMCETILSVLTGVALRVSKGGKTHGLVASRDQGRARRDAPPPLCPG